MFAALRESSAGIIPSASTGFTNITSIPLEIRSSTWSICLFESLPGSTEISVSPLASTTSLIEASRATKNGFVPSIHVYPNTLPPSFASGASASAAGASSASSASAAGASASAAGAASGAAASLEPQPTRSVATIATLKSALKTFFFI